MLALLPTVQSVVDTQRRAILHDYLKQLAFAMHAYHDKHRTLPPHAVFEKAGKPLLSWRVLILPYLGQEDLYQQFKLEEPSYRRLLAEKYGVRLNLVAGCVVWPWEIGRAHV